MQYISDPELLKELNRGFAPPAPASSGAPRSSPEVEEDQGWLLGKGGWGGVGEAAKQRVLSGLASIAATSTVDPEASNYSKRVGIQAAKRAEEQEKTLGTAGRFAAGGAQYAPAIAGGIVNPVLGAGLAAGMSYGDILSEQQKLTGEYDPQAAKLGAAAVGAIDLATAGMGSKLLGAAKKPLQRVAAGVAEDATASGGSQVATNLAVGKDWSEGVPEALVGGAAVGQGLRGINRAAQFAVNKSGEKAISDTTKIQREHNVNLDPTFADNFAEYSNAAEALRTKAKESTNPVDRADAIAAFTNLSSKNAGEAAKMNAYLLATDNGVGLTDAALNYNYSRDLGKTGPQRFAGADFGLTPEKVGKISSLNEEARPSVLRNQKAKVAGETRESHFKQVQDKGKDVLSKVMGNFNSNQALIDNRVDELIATQKLNPWQVSDDTLSKYEDLSSALSKLNTLSNSYVKGRDVSSMIERQSRRAMELATELGEIDNLKGFDGTPGSFNPIMDIMTASHLEKMLVSEFPAFHEGVPKVSKELPGIVTSPAEKAAALTAMVVAPATIPLVAGRAALKRGAEVISAGRSQGRLRKAKEKTAARGQAISEFARQVQTKQPTVKETLVDEAIIRGEPEIAAKAAESALSDAGIVVPETASAKRAAAAAENERLWREAGLARKPAPMVEPAITPEATPEAPIAAPTVAPEVMAKPRKETPKERRKRLREERRADRTISTEQPPMSPEIEAIAERRPVDIAAARKPAKPVEEVAPVEVLDEVTTVTKKGPDLGAARKVTKPTEETPAPVVEDVVTDVVEDVVPVVKSAPDQRLTRQPSKPVEDVVESVVEPEVPVVKAEPDQRLARAAVKPSKEEVTPADTTPPGVVEDVAESVVEAPAKKFVDLVSKPVRNRIEEIESLPAKELNNKLTTELGALRAKEKATGRVIEDVAREEGVDADVVARHIHEAGGIENLGEKYKAVLKKSIQTEKDELAQAARTKAKELRTRLAEESQARKKAESETGQTEAERARAVKRVEVEAEAARKAEEKSKLTTGFSTMAQAKDTLYKIAGDKPSEDIKKVIDSFTRDLTGSDKGPTVAQMRSAVNKVIDALEKAKKAEVEAAKSEKARYEAWLEKGQSDFTVDEAAYKARKDQLQQRLKKNLEQAKRDKGPRSLVQKEVERIQKEHTKEVKRLDAWLRRGDQDRVVQEAEFKQKAAELREKVQKLNSQIEEGKKVVTKVENSQEVVVQAMQKTKEATEALETAKKASEVKAKDTVEEEVKRAEERAEKEFSEATEAELKEVAKHYSSEYLDSDMDAEGLAQTAGILKGLSKETSDEKVRAVTTELSNLFEEAAKRKEANPDNPETWITSDMFNKVKAERFGDADQSWVGSLSQNLTRAILGKGKAPKELKTEAQVREILAENKRIAEMTTEEKASIATKAKAAGVLAAKARTKGIAQAPKKGRLIKYVG